MLACFSRRTLIWEIVIWDLYFWNGSHFLYHCNCLSCLAEHRIFISQVCNDTTSKHTEITRSLRSKFSNLWTHFNLPHMQFLNSSPSELQDLCYINLTCYADIILYAKWAQVHIDQYLLQRYYLKYVAVFYTVKHHLCHWGCGRVC